MENLENLLNEVKEALNNVNDIQTLNDIKVKYMGKKGLINDLTSTLRDLSIEEKKVFGAKLNELKMNVTNLLEEKKKEIETRQLNEKLKNEKIDINLPATTIKVGSASILEQLIEDLEQLMMSMGYDVVEGPEVEKDLYNFELLNLPKSHPARDAQDSFYTKDDTLLLRSQTSPVQARTMLKGEGKTPIRMICPGKTYRRDDDDATHSHQFMQAECLVVDKGITMSDLKGTLTEMFEKILGPNTKVRFRPSYFPFTEPSVEVDVTCFKCGGKGCPLCKGNGWIEVLGAGMVHPNVLRMGGYDPEEYQGFAFGVGIERITMLRHGIDDIRNFYINDPRFLKQF